MWLGEISLGEIMGCPPGNNSGLEMERPKQPINYFTNLIYR
jgi:hypothetical protein